jgi:hypothetical protein
MQEGGAQKPEEEEAELGNTTPIAIKSIIPVRT